ncbi:MAG TPA: hypothetical protein VHM20_02380 [Gammaproteobacteria bacterium]|jgi:hypothetical protein|nr:hypothetical protein [Gammaproteobacteria bacterium]
MGFATILFSQSGRDRKINFLLLNILSAIGVFSGIIITYKSSFHGISQLLIGIKEFLILLFIFIGTFFYGIIEMAILDRIGLEEKNSSKKGMILHAYGLMSIAAVLGL